VAESIRQLIRKSQGVSSVNVSLITGSVLVHYDFAETDAATLLQKLRDGRHVTGCGPAARPRMQPEQDGVLLWARQRLARTLLEYVLQRVFERATVLLIAAVL
jgi:hypothetical protein